MKKIFLLYLLLNFDYAFAQKNRTVSGFIADVSKHETPIAYATVSIYKITDSTLVNYKLSDDKGFFRITGLENEVKYRLIVNAWQYKILRKEVLIKKDDIDLKLDSIFLSPNENSLNEVIVTGERPPIIVRKDTIEFNAESFKTLPSAVVEDLLKKLPGVNIDQNGNFRVNGKSVSKILVDGKDFFSGDQQIATKNLPANIIDKVQVTADKEVTRSNPYLSDAEIPQVINLKLKKAIKKGAFGKIYGASNINTLYSTGAIMNVFKDTTQISLLAYGNNINKPGFSIGDVRRLGGFDRSGVSSSRINFDGGFELNGVSFGGTHEGIQSSQGGGANFNTLTKSGVKINTQYFFGRSDNLTRQIINNNQNLGENRLITNSNSNGNKIDVSHRIAGEIKWDIDSLTDISIKPSFRFGTNKLNRYSTKNNINQNGALINKSDNNSIQDNNIQEYGINVNFWKDFIKKGRTFNTSFNLTKNNNPQQLFNNAINEFFIPTSSINSINQLRDNNIENLRGYLSLNYSEPISKKLSFSTNMSANYLDNENALFTYFLNPNNQNYDIVIPSLSETVNQKGYKTQTSIGFDWKATKNLSIRPGITYNSINLKNNFINFNDFDQNFSFLGPALSIRYKSLNISYNTSFREPNVNYIQPVGNNTDPLFIQNGNANLRPTTTQSIYLNTYKYDTKKSLSYDVYLSGTIQNNAIIMSRSIDESGIQINTPINSNNIWSIYNSGNINKDFKAGNTSFKAGFGYNYNYNRNKLIINQIQSNVINNEIGPDFSLDINFNDVLELNQNYYRVYQQSSYEDDLYTDLKNTAQSLGTEIILRYPKKIVWESNYELIINNQQIQGFKNNIQIWNAAVTFLFMKNDRAQLKLSVNDILQTNVRRYIRVYENSITDTQTNNLGRYGLITLTYNIQNFGEKIGGKQRFLGF